MAKDNERYDKRYDKSYYASVCPYCNHKDCVEIYTGQDGFFTFKTFSHYKCSKCSREFKSEGFLSLCPTNEVKRIVCLGLDKKISKKEMKEMFREIGVFYI